MNMTLDMKLLETNLETIKSIYKFEYFTTEAICALVYTAQGATADRARLEECRRLMKSKYGVFSDFRGNLQLPLVIKMSLADDPEAYLRSVADTYDLLSAAYKLGNTSRLLAAMVIHENAPLERRAEICEKTRDIYARFRENHPWLTSQEDMPFAALMAMRNYDVDAQIAETERCYAPLKARFRFSHNEIQTVSHILALSAEPADQKVDYFIRLYDGMKAEKRKISGYHLPILGLLAISGIAPEDAIEETIRHDEALRKITGFHGLLGVSASDRKMIAASITALEHAQDAASITALMGSAVMSTVLTTIISIEIMIMMMAASSAAAATSSN